VDSAERTSWHREALAASVDSVAAARRAVTEVAADAGVTGLRLGELELLVSEVVTNAILHSGSEDVIVSICVDDRVRVRVEDHGSGVPIIAPPVAVGGLGLRLVDRLSTSWGVDAILDGKVVWFDLPRHTG
jgi:anti-sigma regulatory factor (Ser/Thr protein kinase)